MSTFKEKAVTELLTVLPADQKGATAFLAGAARAAGALHMRGKRCNLVLSLPSYEACLAVVDLLKLLYPSEFEVTGDGGACQVGRQEGQHRLFGLRSHRLHETGARRS